MLRYYMIDINVTIMYKKLKLNQYLILSYFFLERHQLQFAIDVVTSIIHHFHSTDCNFRKFFFYLSSNGSTTSSHLSVSDNVRKKSFRFWQYNRFSASLFSTKLCSTVRVGDIFSSGFYFFCEHTLPQPNILL